MFSNNLVAVIKCEGKILREKKDKVYLPFGSEYSILIKNLNSRDALVNIWIDGEPIFDICSGLIVKADSEIELDRYYHTNNRFKFIEKTQEIIDQRGDNIEDGIIKIEFQFAKCPNYYAQPLYQIIRVPYWNSTPYFIIRWDNPVYTLPTNSSPPKQDFVVINSTNHNTSNTAALNYFLNTSTTNNSQELDVSEEGITTKGSPSNQKFCYGYIEDLDNARYVMCFQLRGYRKSDKEKVTEPILTNKKIRCEVCGKKVSTNQNYCDRCGTALF